MKFYSFIFSVFFLSFFILGCGSSANKVNPALIDSTVVIAPPLGNISPEDFTRFHEGVKDYYEQKLVKRGFNGGIIVAKGGRIIFEDYHGYANFATKDTLTRHSAFHLASVSKTFTAMAILKLAEMNKLSLNDSLQKFFPAFPYKGITVQELLNHRSGLPNYTHFMENLGWNRKQYSSNEDVLDYLIKYTPPGTGRPNTHFNYCNTNYVLLAMIIEKASNMTYADFLQEVFFTPLKMNDTYVFSMVKDSASAMPSYDARGRIEPYTFLDLNYGDKNIYSTPSDLLKWDQALYTNKLFSPATFDEAFTPYSNEKPGVKNYGLGWRMNVYPDGKKVVYHNGWWHGNNTVFIRMIQDSVTIIVLGNKYNPLIYKSKDIADVFDSGLKIEDE
ncbi:MAG: serine hydrolase domain-containing protein [Ginsengibacter sp.]